MLSIQSSCPGSDSSVDRPHSDEVLELLRSHEKTKPLAEEIAETLRVQWEMEIAIDLIAWINDAAYESVEYLANKLTRELFDHLPRVCAKRYAVAVACLGWDFYISKERNPPTLIESCQLDRTTCSELSVSGPSPKQPIARSI